MARPRSARAHDAVLNAALSLFAERGIDATSMDAIAHASGVSKATIYKHWPDKDALCLEVMLRVHGGDAGPPEVDSGDLRAELLAVLNRDAPEEYAELRMRIMPHLMAHAARNPAFAKAWRARVLEPPRSQLARVLDRAVARGQLPSTLNTELAIALLHGPVVYGHVLKMIDKKTPASLRELVVDAFMRSYALTSRPEERR
jgi:AcrR family transcriptional regulator